MNELLLYNGPITTDTHVRSPRGCPLRSAAMPGGRFFAADGSARTSSAAAVTPVNASSRSSTLERGGVTGGGVVRQWLAAYGRGSRGRPLAFFPCRRVARGSRAKRQMATSQGEEAARTRVPRLAFDVRYIYFFQLPIRPRSTSTSWPPSLSGCF